MMTSTRKSWTLRDDTVRRLVDEERLRAQVRSELQPPVEPSSTWFKVMNTPVVLLLLSSVFVGGLGKLYSDQREQAEKARATQQEVVRLKAEFNHRYQYARNLTEKLKAAGRSPEDVQGLSVLLWRTVVGQKEFMPAMPEYKENHWGGILARLQALGISASSEVENAIYDLDASNDNWHYDLERVEQDLKTIDGFRRGLKPQS